VTLLAGRQRLQVMLLPLLLLLAHSQRELGRRPVAQQGSS
jgi:hypothetical protein